MLRLVRYFQPSAADGSMLTEPERLAVVVTEMLRLLNHPDAVVRSAAGDILVALLDDPRLADEDRRLIDVGLPRRA